METGDGKGDGEGGERRRRDEREGREGDCAVVNFS